MSRRFLLQLSLLDEAADERASAMPANPLAQARIQLHWGWSRQLLVSLDEGKIRYTLRAIFNALGRAILPRFSHRLIISP